MSAYPRNSTSSSSRRAQRPSSFSGTRSRNIYSSSNPIQNTFSYPYSTSAGSWSPTTSSYSAGLTTYGGTPSGYGGLTVPNPNTYHSSYLNNYNRSSSPSYSPRSSFIGSSYTTSPASTYSPNAIGKSATFDFNLKRPASSSSLASLRSTGSEGYASGNGDKSGRSSRLSSASSVADEDFNTNQINASSPSENGELDYKKLYEETLVENERLRDKLRKTEDDLTECKLRLTDSSSSSSSTTNKNSLSEIEKREKRAMERKLSEMEEELKQLQKLKAENERLRAENRALTRVVSKLTTSANAVK